MSIDAARVGDRCSGRCSHPSHDDPINVGGTIIEGSSDVVVNGRGHARIGDKVRSDCGHIGTIITGDSSVLVNGRGAARLGDRTTGYYKATIISASSDTLT